MRYALRALLFCVCLSPAFAPAQTLNSSELSRLRSVDAVAFSPDGRYLAYTTTMRDRPGRPYSRLSVMELSTQKIGVSRR